MEEKIKQSADIGDGLGNELGVASESPPLQPTQNKAENLLAKKVISQFNKVSEVS